MITIISGTNRPNNKTQIIAKAAHEYLLKKGLSDTLFLDLQDINVPFIHDQMYNEHTQHDKIIEIQDTFIIPADHFVIVSPEYNGSYPGVLKSFIDAISVRKYKETFNGKKASLIGVASGRAGNFRGMEHLTGLLNYLSIFVMPNKLPISSISTFLDENLKINLQLQSGLEIYLDEVIKFNQK